MVFSLVQAVIYEPSLLVQEVFQQMHQNFTIRTTVPSYISPTLISFVISFTIFRASFAEFKFSEAMNTRPSSSMSILTPVSAIILFITFPPGPITSPILSDLYGFG